MVGRVEVVIAGQGSSKSSRVCLRLPTGCRLFRTCSPKEQTSPRGTRLRRRAGCGARGTVCGGRGRPASTAFTAAARVARSPD